MFDVITKVQIACAHPYIDADAYNTALQSKFKKCWPFFVLSAAALGIELLYFVLMEHELNTALVLIWISAVIIASASVLVSVMFMVYYIMAKLQLHDR
jgi:hypothetical protein